MSTDAIDGWTHDHAFGQDRPMPGERRTLIVVAITATMMVVEITCGVLYGSMALLADGLHMASHAIALVIAYGAYVFARRYARDERFSFGTGKVNSLAGFTGAILLAGFALMMAWESIDRLFHPVVIQFNQAIVVAIIGLVVNAVSAVILGGHGHAHGEGHDQGHTHGGDHDHRHHHHDDHNLRSAYLHVIADALTSLFAIIALLGGKFLGLAWLDPVMGIVGATLVAHWSVGLAQASARVLLDRRAPERVREVVRAAVEADDAGRVSDLHVWSVGPGRFAAIIAVVTDDPKPPAAYKTLLPEGLGLVHVTVEVNTGGPPAASRPRDDRAT
ncbi:MAG: CDF family Co(II)/Ni(II) efflux transporter DmeF [Planctomycetota bacterium]|jgi:cation diffusion facilitator family transporter